MHLRTLVAAAATVMLAACGGGEGPASNAEAISTALQARAQPLEAPSASVASRADTIFQIAQSKLPTLLTGSPTTSVHAGLGLLYRQYSNGVVFAYVGEDKGVGLVLDGVYVAGGPFTRVTLVGKAADLGFGAFPSTTDTSGSTTGTKNLTVQIVSPVALTYNLGPMPVPPNGAFCDGITSDATFKSIAVNGGGTFAINSCTWDGSTATVNATLSITSPSPLTFQYTIKYIYS